MYSPFTASMHLPVIYDDLKVFKLHCVHQIYYFRVSPVRIKVSSWLLTRLANKRRASSLDARTAAVEFNFYGSI